jgi:hypothetical protein
VALIEILENLSLPIKIFAPRIWTSIESTYYAVQKSMQNKPDFPLTATRQPRSAMSGLRVRREKAALSSG